MSSKEKEMSSKGKTNIDRLDKPEDSTSTVHSANHWENADLGDDDRRQKFLKLMGASKKQHHGKLIIGEPDVSACADKSAGDAPKPLVSDVQLESQFKKGVDHRLQGGYRGHIGLGFQDDDPVETTDEKKLEENDESKDDGKTESVKEESDMHEPEENVESKDDGNAKTESVKEESDIHEHGEKRKEYSSGETEPNPTLSKYSNMKKMKFVKSSS